MAVRIKTDIRRWLQELDKKYFLVMLGFSAFVFFPLIALRLTNTVDGCGRRRNTWPEPGSFPTAGGSGW